MGLFVGDTYFDFSLALTKIVESGFSVSFPVINTSLDENDVPRLRSSGDSPNSVVILNKGFDTL